MISIDIGTSKIYVAETTGKGKNVKVQNLKVIPMSTNVFIYDGKIRKDILKDYLVEAFNGIKDKDVTITFSELPIVSNEFVLPYILNQAKMSTMIKAKVYQTLSEEEYIFDYKVTSTFMEGKQKQCNVVTYLAPRSIVMDTYDVISELGKKPVKFTNTQDSIFNFASYYLPNKVSILINITDKNMVLHLNNLPNNIITRVAVIDDLNESFEKTEMESGENGMISLLNDQILKLVQYQTIKYLNRGIENIVLAGDVNKAMKDSLTSELGIPTTMLSELSPDFLHHEEKDWSPFIYAISAVV